MQVYIKDTEHTPMSTHFHDLPVLLCQLAALGHENWHTGMDAAGGAQTAAGREEAHDAAENTEAAAEVPKGPLVEVVDLLTVIAKVPEEDLLKHIEPSVLQRIRSASNKTRTIFDETKLPQIYHLNELWWSTSQGNPNQKVNLILNTLLKAAPSNAIRSIEIPECMRSHVPNQATMLARVLSQCPSLSNLDLSESQIAWQEIEQFKVPIKLTSLTVLDLNDCALDHERYSILRFFNMIQSWQCEKLQYLDLSDNNFNDANIDWRPLLRQLTRLDVLNLSRCRLSWSNIANVTEGLRICTTLTDLDLSCNRLGGFVSAEGIHVLFDGLCDLPILEILDLHHTEMDDDNLRFLAQKIPTYPALKNLDISENTFRDDGIRSLIEVLPRCTTLTQLDLHGTRFRETAQHLVQACISLSRDDKPLLLNLSECVLTADDIRGITRLRRGTQCYVLMENQEDYRLWMV